MILTPLALSADLTAAGCALWRIDLDQHVPAAALAKLSADEVARARRFVFPRDRHRFIAAHAALRQLLAQHSGQSNEELRFVFGRFGKPALRSAGPYFNLSHSQGTGLVALSTGDETGVDVEAVRAMPDALALAAAHFSPAEQAALAACPAADRDRAFFVCWTRKEACLKAVGVGLDLALDGFEVGIAPIAQTLVLTTPDGDEQLRLRSFEAGDGTIGALALRQPRGAVRPSNAGAPASVPLASTA